MVLAVVLLEGEGERGSLGVGSLAKREEDGLVLAGAAVDGPAGGGIAVDRLGGGESALLETRLGLGELDRPGLRVAAERSGAGLELAEHEVAVARDAQVGFKLIVGNSLEAAGAAGPGAGFFLVDVTEEFFEEAHRRTFG